MTSLQHQLKKLKKAPTHALEIERDYSSLIYNRKEAAAYDREDFYKIGLAGLHGMMSLDENFDTYAPELFEKDKLNFNRAMLSKKEAAEFDQQIEGMIIRLSPYLHHQCCRQVLEWFIHQYQVHTFNSEILFLTFLPHHSTNTFGRLIHILKFNSPDFNWLAEFQKDASPIPLNVLCRACQAGHSYWLITAITAFLQKQMEILDENYVNIKLQHYFTFLTALYGILIENKAGKLDEQFVSKLMPFLGNALRSKLTNFKCAGIMILCVLVMNTTLDEEVVDSILKLLWHKVDTNLCELVLKTTNVVCEHLALTKLPKKSVLRLVNNGAEYKLGNLFGTLMLKNDMTALLVPFWQILMDELKTGEHQEFRANYTILLLQLLDLERINERQAKHAFGLLLDWVESIMVEEGKYKPEGLGKMRIFPKTLRKHTRAMVIRFSTVFDLIKSKRREESIQRLMEECRISQHEVEQMEIAKNDTDEEKQITKRTKKRRNRKRLFEDDEHEQRDRVFTKIKLEDTDNS